MTTGLGQIAPPSGGSGGGLTDAQLRASPVPVLAGQSGGWTVSQSGTWTVGRTWTLSNGTDSVAVSGTVTANQGGSNWSVNFAQYAGTNVGAANAVHVQPGTGASFLTTNANLDVALSTRLKPADTLTKVATVDTITNAVTVTNSNLDVALSTRLKPADTLAGVTTVGAVTSITNPLPAGTNVIGHVITDTGSTVSVSNFPGTQPVSVASLPLPSNAAQETGGNLAAVYANDTQNMLPTLQLILAELRVITAFLAAGLNVTDDPNALRNDLTLLQ